jgi:antitoxin VapB
MALNIKDPLAEQLAAEVAELTGETKTSAVRIALAERRDRLRSRVGTGDDRAQRLQDFLERELWPQIPPDLIGHAPDRAEREDILGYGPEGV